MRGPVDMATNKQLPPMTRANLGHKWPLDTQHGHKALRRVEVGTGELQPSFWEVSNRCMRSSPPPHSDAKTIVKHRHNTNHRRVVSALFACHGLLDAHVVRLGRIGSPQGRFRNYKSTSEKTQGKILGKKHEHSDGPCYVRNTNKCVDELAREAVPLRRPDLNPRGPLNRRPTRQKDPPHYISPRP